MKVPCPKCENELILDNDDFYRFSAWNSEGYISYFVKCPECNEQYEIQVKKGE